MLDFIQTKIHFLIQNSFKASGEVKQKRVHFILKMLISLFPISLNLNFMHITEFVFFVFFFRANIIFVIHRNSSSA